MTPDPLECKENSYNGDEVKNKVPPGYKSDSTGKEKPILAKYIGTDYNYKIKPYWPNVTWFLIIHILSLWGLWMMVSGQAQWKTILWGFLILHTSSEGIAIGAHRFYTHRSFKATAPLRAVFLLLQTVAGQNCTYTWVRDHRQHHRYSDTDADPHNAKRGFFFSHIGWLMSLKHPMVLKMGQNLDLSDLEADWMVMFQKKYFKSLYFVFSMFIPVAVPIYFWGEDWLLSVMVLYMFRYTLSLNGTWLINSAAHIYGTRPYDKNIQPVESWFVSMLSSGEGWHNYHHAYPRDYKAAELGMHFNASAQYIRWFEKLGLAYDLREASHESVKRRVLRTGDGTHHELGTDEAKAAVTAAGGILVHPLNPTYTATARAPAITVHESGLPLTPEEEPIDSDLPASVQRRRNVGPSERAY